MLEARLAVEDALKLGHMSEAQRELAVLLTNLLEYMQRVEARLTALEAAQVHVAARTPWLGLAPREPS